jgi:hypothetical protein
MNNQKSNRKLNLSLETVAKLNLDEVAGGKGSSESGGDTDGITRSGMPSCWSERRVAQQTASAPTA